MMKKIASLFPLLLAFFAFTACDKDDDIKVDLPESITAFIEANYPDYEIEEAERETLCTEIEVYDVELEKDDEPELGLTFDLEGNLLFTEIEIAEEELPSDVTNSIAANYADFSIEEAERLEAVEGSNQYEVELENGQTTLEVLFDADGTVVCEEEEDDNDD